MPGEIPQPNPEETPEQQTYREAVQKFVDVTDKLVNHKVTSTLRAMGYDPDHLSPGGVDGRPYNPDDPKFRQEYSRLMSIRDGIERALANKVTGQLLCAAEPGVATLASMSQDGQHVEELSTFRVMGDKVIDVESPEIQHTMNARQVNLLTTNLRLVYNEIQSIENRPPEA